MVRIAWWYAGVLCAAAGGLFAEEGAKKEDVPLYANDFEKAEAGATPADFLVLDGAFSVKADGENKVLNTPGAPIDARGFLFGPPRDEGMAVRLRVRGEKKGQRLYPLFGVGVGGIDGWRLTVAPALGEVQLARGEAKPLKKAAFTWKNAAWTWIHLEVSKTKEGAWQVAGKAWTEGTDEPKEWTLVHAVEEAPVSGRAYAFASPFSGKDVQFDDLKVTAGASPAEKEAVSPAKAPSAPAAP